MAIARHDNIWNSISQTCHRVRHMSWGSTLQNVDSSITKSTVGIRNSAVCWASGLIGDS